jgi:hypothetical protein
MPKNTIVFVDELAKIRKQVNRLVAVVNRIPAARDTERKILADEAWELAGDVSYLASCIQEDIGNTW